MKVGFVCSPYIPEEMKRVANGKWFSSAPEFGFHVCAGMMVMMKAKAAAMTTATYLSQLFLYKCKTIGGLDVKEDRLVAALDAHIHRPDF